MLGCVGHDETAAPLRLTQPIRIQGDQQNPTLSLTRRDQDTIVGQGDRKGIGGAVVSTRRRGFVVSRIPRHFTMTDPRMTVVGRDGRMQDVPTAVGVGKSQAFVPEKDQSIVRQADQACRRIGREQGGRSRGRPLCTICGERLVESSELCANQHPQIIWPAFDDHGLHSTIGADTRRLHLEFSVVNPPGLSIVAREHDRFARAGKPEGVQALASRSPGAICELGKGQHETPILHLDGGIDRPRIPLPDSNGFSPSAATLICSGVRHIEMTFEKRFRLARLTGQAEYARAGVTHQQHMDLAIVTGHRLATAPTSQSRIQLQHGLSRRPRHAAIT